MARRTARLQLQAAACVLLILPAALSLPSDAPIPAKTMQSLIGRGFDVRWAEFNQDIAAYSPTKPQTTAKFGFQNVRIRVDDDLSNASYARHLDTVINDALDAGLIAILAKKGEDLKYHPTSPSALNDYVTWWQQAAERYANVSHRLMFDLMVEPAKALGSDLSTLNKAYLLATTAIRPSNPSRIISYAPGHIASALYLDRLVIPAAAFPYAIAEWHDFAAGPNPDPSSKKYWSGNGTAAQRASFVSVVDTAVKWQSSTGGAPTWFGAWMSNNFNSGANYSVAEQVAFATFICETMTAASLPWSINTYVLFFQQNDMPVPELEPVLQVISPVGATTP